MVVTMKTKTETKQNVHDIARIETLVSGQREVAVVKGWQGEKGQEPRVRGLWVGRAGSGPPEKMIGVCVLADTPTCGVTPVCT